MKIAHIVCAYPPYYGGMGNVAYQTVEALAALGQDVRVYTPQYYANNEIKPSDKETTHHDESTSTQIAHVHRLAPSFSYGNAARMKQLQTELEDVDIVHLHYPFFGTAGMVRKWRTAKANRRLVVTYHMDTRAPGWKGVIFALYAKYYLPKVLSAADACITSSFDYIRDSQAGSHYAANKHIWHELPFGVDTDRFTPRNLPQVWYDQLALDPSKPTILFVGGMDAAHYFKGVDYLLQALKMLHNAHLHFQAVFVGDGSLRQTYELHAKGMGLTGQVLFIGKVGDDLLPNMYNLADVLVLPSIHRGEAFGMVLLEAMASGVPVVASDLPGVRTIANLAGVVVPPQNAQAIAEGIMTVLEQPSLAEQARDVAKKLFNWESRTKKLLDIYIAMCS